MSVRERDWSSTSNPRLRAEVRIGPRLFQGSEEVHFISDSATTAFFRVGVREGFLLSRLDGSHTLGEISSAYQARFGLTLADANWAQLLTMLAMKGLLEPAGAEHLQAIRERAESARRTAPRNPLLRRFPLPGLAGLVPTVARGSSWLFHPGLLIPLSILGAFVGVWSVMNGRELWVASTSQGEIWRVYLPVYLVTFVTIVCHEFGHGVACVRYGGRPQEVGVMWRFPMLAAYCKVDDVVTFRKASHWVVTAFAGIYVNLLFMIGFAAVRILSTPGSLVHAVAATLLIISTMATIVNALPVLQLDGYRMLEGVTSTSHLRSSSFRYVALLLRSGGQGVRAYPRRLAVLYICYVLVSFVIILPIAFLVVGSWWMTLEGLWGGAAATLFLSVEFSVIGAFIVWVRRRRLQRDAAFS